MADIMETVAELRRLLSLAADGNWLAGEELIVAMRNALPALLDYIERKEAMGDGE